MRRWADFDLLAPQDRFGYMGQGSWFWGEKGDDFVARAVDALIAHMLQANGYVRWFGIGCSMGGFAAIYHGIGRQADAVYAQVTQIDMADMIAREVGTERPYRNLVGKRGREPDLFAAVERSETLPALMLLQGQFDPVNGLARHGLRLAEAWTRKGGWLSMRIYPSAYHFSDGSQTEAEAFFRLAADKLPGRERSSLPGSRGISGQAR